MHAANSSRPPNREDENDDQISPDSSMVSSSLRLSIKEQQENMLYSPKSPIVQDGAQASSIPLPPPLELLSNTNTQNDTSIAVTGVPNHATTIIDGMYIKPYLAEELLSLLRGYEASSIARAIRSDVTSSLTAAYPSVTAPELQFLRNRSIRSRSRLSLVPEDAQFGWRRYLSSMYSPGYSRSGASWFDQLSILSGRTFKNLYRNPDLLLTHYAISVIMAIVCGLLYWKVDDTLSGFQNRLGVMFFICALFGFGCLSSMQSFATERLIFLRERANRYYSPVTYFISKV